MRLISLTKFGDGIFFASPDAIERIEPAQTVHKTDCTLVVFKSGTGFLVKETVDIVFKKVCGE